MKSSSNILGSATLTGINPAAFTNSTSFGCVANDKTSQANGVKSVPASAAVLLSAVLDQMSSHISVLETDGGNYGLRPSRRKRMEQPEAEPETRLTQTPWGGLLAVTSSDLGRLYR